MTAIETALMNTSPPQGTPYPSNESTPHPNTTGPAVRPAPNPSMTAPALIPVCFGAADMAATMPTTVHEPDPIPSSAAPVQASSGPHSAAAQVMSIDPTDKPPIHRRGRAGSPARSAMRPHTIRPAAPTTPYTTITIPAAAALMPIFSWK